MVTGWGEGCCKSLVLPNYSRLIKCVVFFNEFPCVPPHNDECRGPGTSGLPPLSPLKTCSLTSSWCCAVWGLAGWIDGQMDG